MSSYISRRSFLLCLGAVVGAAALSMTEVKRAGLFAGVDPAVDDAKESYCREKLKGLSMEGQICCKDGTAITVAAGEGMPATVTSTAFSSVAGYRSARYGASGLRKTYAEELCYAEQEHGRGATLTTTLCGELQTYLYSKLDCGSRGSCCVLDAETGAVLAMAERPSGNIEFEVNSLSEEKMVLYNNAKEFWYPVITTCNQQAGSVQKIIDAASIYASGVPEDYTDTGVSATGITNAGNAVYGDSLSVEKMLVHSINTYAADVSSRVDGELFNAMLEEFGYNKSVDLDGG